MKKSHILALVIVGLMIGVIISTSTSYSTYETFATAITTSGKDFQVVGELEKDGEMVYDPLIDPNMFSFHMKDKAGDVRKVIYAGAKPQDFERSEQIVLTGHIKGEDFFASKILLKCPSKYIEDELDEDGFYDASKSEISENR